MLRSIAVSVPEQTSTYRPFELSIRKDRTRFVRDSFELSGAPEDDDNPRFAADMIHTEENRYEPIQQDERGRYIPPDQQDVLQSPVVNANPCRRCHRAVRCWGHTNSGPRAAVARACTG